jgi:hypothetical protein
MAQRKGFFRSFPLPTEQLSFGGGAVTLNPNSTVYDYSVKPDGTGEVTVRCLVTDPNEMGAFDNYASNQQSQ